MTRIWLLYLDDVIVYSRSYFQNLRYLRAVFKRLRIDGLKLKPFKYQLFKDYILYFGHVVNFVGVSPDPTKLCVLSILPVHETVRDI